MKKSRLRTLLSSILALSMLISMGLTVLPVATSAAGNPNIHSGAVSIMGNNTIRINRTNLSLTAGKTYYLSYWLKAQAGTTTGPTLGIWTNGNQTPDTVYDDKVSPIWNAYTISDSEWHQYTAEILPVVTSDRYAIGIDCRTTSHSGVVFYIDDVNLIDVESGASLIDDGNFENASQSHYGGNGNDWMTANWINDNWFSEYAYYTHQYNNPDGPKALNIVGAPNPDIHSGTASIKTDKNACRINRTSLYLEAGKSYTFTYWLKTKAGATTGPSLATWVNGANPPQEEVYDDKVDPVWNGYTVADDNWNKYTATVLPPITAGNYTIGIDCRSSEDFYIDDVSLVESGSSVNLIADGDFEYAYQKHLNGDGDNWSTANWICDLWFSQYAHQVHQWAQPDGPKALSIIGDTCDNIRSGAAAVLVAKNANRINRGSLSLEAGQDYILTYWLKTKAGASTGATLGIWPIDSNPQDGTAHDDKVDPAWNGYTVANDNWNKYTATVSPAVTSDDYNIGIDCRSTSDFYVDDISLVKVGSTENLIADGDFEHVFQRHFNDNGNDWMTANWLNNQWFSEYAFNVHVYGKPYVSKALTIVGSPSQGGAGYELPPPDRGIPVTDSNVKINGRYYFENDVLFVNYTCAGIEFNFKGTSASAVLYSGNYGADNDAFVAVYVDSSETPLKTLRLNILYGTYLLADGLSEGNHTIKLVKLTEGRVSTFGISGIILEEGGELLAPPSKKTRKIEILGDSIVCGVGVTAPLYNSPSITSTQDGTKTFAYQLANIFNADINFVSASGQGVYSFGTGVFDTAMPKVYSKADMTHKLDENWNFGKYSPDLVIVALGTNDIWALPGSQPVPRNEYKAAVKAFIKDIRTKNPNAAIVWTYGMMLQHYQSEFAEVIHELNDEGDKKLFFIPIEAEQDFDRKAGHPSALYHTWAAKFLAPELADIMLWEY